MRSTPPRASRRDPFRSSRKPVLYIGLRLAAGLNLKQFAGVDGARAGPYLPRRGGAVDGGDFAINGWFARVVYERDEWDETLQSWAKSDTTYYVLLVVWFSQLAVWLTRRVLWVLLRVGQLVNLVFIRQREYDADRYEARMVGADVFAQTCWRLREPSLAERSPCPTSSRAGSSAGCPTTTRN